MTAAVLVPRRDDTCPAQYHSHHARRHGCICPPSESDRARWRRESARRASGQRKATVAWRGALDPMALDRQLGGDTPQRVTAAERLAAVADLTGRGLSATEIGERLRVNARTVVRYRRRLREAA